MKLDEVKKALISKKIVKYDYGDYIVSAYILRFDGINMKHLLELKDVKVKNSVRIVEMKKVQWR